jgi:sugar phosphate isomerase/epimerase
MATPGADALLRIIRGARTIGADIVVLPLLETNALATGPAGRAQIEELAPAFAEARDAGVTLALETDVEAAALAELIDEAGESVLGVCYDLGNAVARGADVSREIATLGARVCAVHVKDRTRNGPSRPLGGGDADVTAFFDALASIGFAGPIVLETPRGSDPIASARANLSFVNDRRPDSAR